MRERNPVAPWGILLALALVLAAICNGAGFYLKRTGLLDTTAYRNYWALHCKGSWDDPRAEVERQCAALSSAADSEAQAMLPPGSPRNLIYRYVYEVPPAERPLKVAKDLFVLALLVGALAAMWRARVRPPSVAAVLPVYLLAASSLVAFAASVLLNGAMVAGAGLRTFLFPWVALAGWWLARQLPAFAIGIAALLAFQFALMPLELIRGIHLFREWGPYPFASRLAGTMVHPNSLGVFAVMGFAFCHAFLRERGWLAPIAIVSVGLIAFSGSATGWVCTVFALVVVAWRPKGALPIVGAAGWLMALVAVLTLFAWLPDLTGREKVLESIGGRLDVLHGALFDRPVAEVVLGSGLGVHSNLAMTLASPGGVTRGLADPDIASVDSTFTALLIQMGVTGVVLFYAVLAWAAWRSPRAMPFFVVAAACSLTLTITELFPVNALLGLALAHCVWTPDRRAPA